MPLARRGSACRTRSSKPSEHTSPLFPLSAAAQHKRIRSLLSAIFNHINSSGLQPSPPPLRILFLVPKHASFSNAQIPESAQAALIDIYFDLRRIGTIDDPLFPTHAGAQSNPQLTLPIEPRYFTQMHPATNAPQGTLLPVGGSDEVGTSGKYQTPPLVGAVEQPHSRPEKSEAVATVLSVTPSNSTSAWEIHCKANTPSEPCWEELKK